MKYLFLLQHLVVCHGLHGNIPQNITEKIEQIRQCVKLHDEITPGLKRTSTNVPDVCYKPAEAELKFGAVHHAARKKRSAGFEFNRLRTDYNANRSQKDMCMKPCAKRDLYADVKQLEAFIDGWRPLLGDGEMINIGECAGNCHTSTFMDYRYMFQTLHQKKIRGCTTSSTSSIEVIKNGYIANFPGFVIETCACNAIHFCT